MTALFQVVLWLSSIAKERFGEPGLFGSAAILGLVDMDALTISMAQLTASGTAAELTARAVTIGVLVNTLVKLAITLVIGRGSFRTLTAIGLVLMALALGAMTFFTA
jgi:uncharacterized membrane protein (DUF4010 family)